MLLRKSEPIHLNESPEEIKVTDADAKYRAYIDELFDSIDGGKKSHKLNMKMLKMVIHSIF